MQSEAINIINKIVDLSFNGELNELQAYILLNDIEKSAKEAKNAIKNDAITIATRYEGKTFDFKDRKITLSSRKVWSYKHCNEWQAITDKRKALEEKMQIACLKGLNIDGETGEVIEPAEYKISENLTIK